MSTHDERNDGTTSVVAPQSRMGEREATEAKTTGAISAGSADQGILVTTLAELPERALLDESALANALRVTKRTVRRMVARLELPPPVRFGGRSTWQVGRVMIWFERRAERLEREARRIANQFNAIPGTEHTRQHPRSSVGLACDDEKIKDR